MLTKPETREELLARLREDPNVHIAAALFNKRRNYRKKCRLGLFDLLERFADPSRSAADIAQEAGVARQAMCKIYDKYVRPLLNGSSCKDRRRHRTFEKNKKKPTASPLTLPLFAPVVERARAAGCIVGTRIVLTKSGHYVATPRTFLVNGFVCQVHRLAQAGLFGSTKIVRCHASQRRVVLAEADFVLFHLCVPGYEEHFFVFPSAVLYKKLFEGTTRDEASFYLPLSRKTLAIGLDIWAYEDAWHLISE